MNRDSIEEQIIHSIRIGGAARRKAEDKLFNLFSYYIKEGTNKHSLTEDEAFSAYSDTILLAIRTIQDGTYRGEAALNTYLHSIFYNKCIDYFRKKSTNRSRTHQTETVSEMLYNLSDKAKPVLEALILKYDWEVLKQQLNLLGDKCRKLLLLSKDGYTTQEIQEALSFKSADVVKTSRLRCIEKLRQMYKGSK